MKAFVQHFLDAGLEAGQERPDVLHKNVIQGFGQIVQATVRCHTTVLRMCIEELQFCCPGFTYVAMADDVFLAPVDNP